MNLSIVMLGTGAPKPNLQRSQSAQVLFIGDNPILIDCGEGTTLQLLKAGVAPQDVKYLWLTHLHADHVLGYGQFLIGGWAAGRRQLTVVGPKGTRKFHDRLIEMFEDDIAYRTSLGRSPNGLLDVNVIEVEEPGVVSCDIPAKVTAESMIHSAPTYAYRFKIGQKVVVFSGDTAPTNALVQLSRGADVLIHDACLGFSKSDYQRPGFKTSYEVLAKGHCSPAQAADTAREAKVKKLVLTHFRAGIDGNKAYLEASEKFSGTVIAPDDLQVISVD